MDVRRTLEEKLLESFDFTNEILATSGPKLDGCLAALIEFYTAHNKMCEFLQWIADREVELADSQYEIFRDKSTIAYKVAAYLLSQRDGRLRLKQSIEPSVQRIRRLTEDLGAADHSEELSLKFLEDLLKIVSEIINSLVGYFGTFPLMVRELFAMIAKKSEENFSCNSFMASAVLFRRFLCPWMLDSDAVGAPFNPATLRLLIVVCKIILSLFSSSKALAEASEVLKIHICRFINENSARMIELDQHFIDAADIAHSKELNSKIETEIQVNSSLIDNLVELFEQDDESDSDHSSETSEPLSTCTTSYFGSYDEESDEYDSHSIKGCETESFSTAIPMQNFNSHRTNVNTPTTEHHSNGRSLPESVYDREVLTVTGETISFGSIIKNQHVLLMLLRHSGCMFFRRSAFEFNQIERLLAQHGIKLVAIVPGTVNSALKFKRKFNFAGDIYIDSERRIYDDLGCKHGFKEVFNKNTLKAIISTWGKGYRQGKTHGSVTQLGGLFIIREDGTYMRHIEQFAGDFVDLQNVLYECGVDTETVENLRLKTPKEIRREQRQANKLENRLKTSFNQSMASDTDTDD